MDAKHTPLMLLLIAIILAAMLAQNYLEPEDSGCCTSCSTPTDGADSDTVFVVPGDTVMVTGADSLAVRRVPNADRASAKRLILR
jgi:hypothetical protein